MAEYDNEDIKKTIEEGKRLSSLVEDYVKLELVDKGSSIISKLIIIIVIIAISTIALFCLCMALYHCLLAKTQDPILSYSIIGFFLLFICAIIILMRKSLIENPIIRFLSRTLFNGNQ